MSKTENPIPFRRFRKVHSLPECKIVEKTVVYQPKSEGRSFPLPEFRSKKVCLTHGEISEINLPGPKS